MGPPSVQAAYMKQFAARVHVLGAAGQRVVAADPGLFREIDASSRMSWLPVELNVRMIDALYGALGPRRAREFQSDQITSQFGTPLWRSFVEGGVRLLGLDPGDMVRWLPSALGLIFRDCGGWSIERGDGSSAVLCAWGLPPVLSAHPHWLDSVAGGIHALFILCKTSGETELAQVDAGQGAARIVIRWKPAVS